MSVIDRAVFMSRALRARITGKRMPLVVVLNVTNRCNLKCIYCYGEYYSRNTKDFTKEQVLSLVDELAKMGTKSITIGGGEPLLRDDIGEIIEYIKSEKIECGMNTNGVLIPKKIDAVKKMDSVCISFDGAEESNDLNRGKGSFRQIFEGIKVAKAHGLHVHTNTVMTKNNIRSIDHIMKLAKEIGFVTEFNLPFFLGERDGTNQELYPTDEECRQAWAKIIDYKEKGYPILFSRKSHQYALDWPNYSQRLIYDTIPDFKYIKCYAGQLMCFIDSDGMVYPCAQLIGTFKGLNFLEHGFEKAWDNLHTNPCKTCYFTCFNHFNLVFKLDRETLLDTVKSSLREI